MTFHQLARSCRLNGTLSFRGQGVSAQSQPAWRGCVSEPTTSRQGGVEGQKEVGSDQGLLPALKEGPFVAETLARAAWPFKDQPPCSCKPTTADDKASAANYPADGESLKCRCQSEGWSLCLQWDKIQERGVKEVRIQGSFCPLNQKKPIILFVFSELGNIVYMYSIEQMFYTCDHSCNRIVKDG